MRAVIRGPHEGPGSRPSTENGELHHRAPSSTSPGEIAVENVRGAQRRNGADSWRTTGELDELRTIRVEDVDVFVT